MAYRIRVTVDYDWVGDGVYSAFLGPNQSNNPGYNATFAAGAAGVAQTAELMISEIVPGGDTPTLANFLTALTNAANDLAGTPTVGATPVMSQVGALYGQPNVTPLAIIQAFATGGA